MTRDHLLGLGPASIDPPAGARVIARLYLPIEMGAVAQVMAALADAYPDAKLAKSDDAQVVVIEVTETPEPSYHDLVL